MSEKIVVTCAVAGAITSKSQNPYLPETPEQQAEEALRAFNAGASVVHIHARDGGRKDRTRNEVLEDTIQRIRDKCKILIQVGTGATDHLGKKMNFEERLKLLDLNPKTDMETINAGTFTLRPVSKTTGFESYNFLNPPELIEAFAKGMIERRIGIEFEIYDVSHILNVLELVDSNIIIKEELNFDFVIGMGGGIPPTLKSLLFLVEHIPQESHFSVLGVGRYEFPMITMGMILGGGVRVGLEDNIHISKGVLAKSNAELVEKAVRIAKELGKEVASVEEARSILHLPAR